MFIVQSVPPLSRLCAFRLLIMPLIAILVLIASPAMAQTPQLTRCITDCSAGDLVATTLMPEITATLISHVLYLEVR